MLALLARLVPKLALLPEGMLNTIAAHRNLKKQPTASPQTVEWAQQVLDQLPEEIGTHPIVAKYLVGADDPRRELHGAWGCRAFKGRCLRAAPTVLYISCVQNHPPGQCCELQDVLMCGRGITLNICQDTASPYLNVLTAVGVAHRERVNTKGA